jgi:Protein of unknown function (DUF4231)
MSNESNYVEGRLSEQTKWYETKANENKSRFHIFQAIIIIASVIIPIVNLIDFATFEIRIISSILGGTVAGVTAFMQLKKYQENWLLYRATEENLEKEKYLFLYGAGPYSDAKDDNRKKILVERVESIISFETSQFFGMHQSRSQTERRVSS